MKDNHLLKDIIEYNKHRLFNFRNGVVEEQNIEYERILKSRYNKVSRIRKHLLYLLSHRKHHYFLTFTEDEYMIKLCERSKRDRIKDCLNGIDDVLFILNIDYGKTTEREHYHAIIGTDSNINVRQYLKDNYACFSDCRKIGSSKTDIKRLSKYVNKLSNHTSKDTTYNKRVVYNFKGFDAMKDKQFANFLYLQVCNKLGL